MHFINVVFYILIFFQNRKIICNNSKNYFFNSKEKNFFTFQSSLIPNNNLQCIGSFFDTISIKNFLYILKKIRESLVLFVINLRKLLLKNDKSFRFFDKLKRKNNSFVAEWKKKKILENRIHEGLYVALITAQFVDPSFQTPSSPRYRSTLTLSRPLGLSGSCMSAYRRDVDRHLSSKTGLYRKDLSLYRDSSCRGIIPLSSFVIICTNDHFASINPGTSWIGSMLDEYYALLTPFFFFFFFYTCIWNFAFQIFIIRG